jgi:hypothetical protein
MEQNVVFKSWKTLGHSTPGVKKLTQQFIWVNREKVFEMHRRFDGEGPFEV